MKTSFTTDSVRFQFGKISFVIKKALGRDDNDNDGDDDGDNFDDNDGGFYGDYYDTVAVVIFISYFGKLW